MSKELIPVLWDDWHRAEDGQAVPATEEVTVSFDGTTWFELDLTPEHAKEFAAFRDRCTTAGTRLDAPPKPARTGPGRPPSKSQYGNATGHDPAWNKRCREWSDARGFRVALDGKRLADHDPDGFPAYWSAPMRKAGISKGHGWSYYYPLWLLEEYDDHLAGAAVTAARFAAGHDTP